MKANLAKEFALLLGTGNTFRSYTDPSIAFHYCPDAGFRFKKADFQWTTWAFAERLFSLTQKPAWRRVRHEMKFQLPSYPFTIK